MNISGYDCPNHEITDCFAYAGCKILVESSQVIEDTSQDIIAGLVNGSTDTSNDFSELQQSYQEGSILFTPDIVSLSELCNEKYITAKSSEECKSLCQPYECK